MTEPALIERADRAREADQWVGVFESGDLGTGVMDLVFPRDKVSAGPLLPTAF